MLRLYTVLMRVFLALPVEMSPPSLSSKVRHVSGWPPSFQVDVPSGGRQKQKGPSSDQPTFPPPSSSVPYTSAGFPPQQQQQPRVWLEAARATASLSLLIATSKSVLGREREKGGSAQPKQSLVPASSLCPPPIMPIRPAKILTERKRRRGPSSSSELFLHDQV